MMAPEFSSRPPHDLDGDTLAAVRQALADMLKTGDGSAEVLRPALRAMAVEAREKTILPEQLLVSLKEVWYALPEVRESQPGPDQTRMLQRVVTMCIREYYAE